MRDFMQDANYHHGNLREELLKHAVEVLNADGFDALSLRALARQIGVSHSAPLRHFATKTDLLRGLADEGVAHLVQKAEQAATAASASERLFQMALAYIEWAQENPAFHRVLRNPEVLRHRSDALNDRLKKFADLQRKEIALAQDEGWRSQDDPEILLLHFMSLTAGTAIVATDPSYDPASVQNLQRDTIAASLRLFLVTKD